MDIVGILNTIKGKVLDAAHFELLQSAYELQNRNIEQLTSNNSALKESNELLKEKDASLKHENTELKQRLFTLESELKEFRNSSSTELSDVARSILRMYVTENAGELFEGDFYSLPFNRVEIDLGVNDLCELDMMVQSRVNMGHGAGFSLTSEGQRRALKLQKK